MGTPYLSAFLEVLAHDSRYGGELLSAKAEFESLCGPLNAESASYEARVNLFHTWYTLERPLKSRQGSPLIAFLRDHPEGAAEAQLPLEGLRELETFRHSLYELRSQRGDQGVLYDLLRTEKLPVRESDEIALLERGALFSTHLFRRQGHYCFGNYLLVHPSGAMRILKKAARRISSDEVKAEAFRFQTLLHYQHAECYSQMPIEHIYRF